MENPEGIDKLYTKSIPHSSEIFQMFDTEKYWKGKLWELVYIMEDLYRDK